MQLENLKTDRNIENNDKQTDGRYQKISIVDKESDEIDQISKNRRRKLIEDKEILKLQIFSSQKNTILRKNLMK